MGYKVEWPRPETLEERTSYCATSMRELSVPSDWHVLVDHMDDHFNATFASWPTSFYVLGRGGDKWTFRHLGVPKPTEAYIDLDALLTYLDTSV
mmetsp:Transcript_32772/g.91794  ORF Transcript_32772/g.91794 Transcript_32772/m.91794 type:complete len:94 (+) Transcript_32772:1087-1368(+)